MTNGREVFWDRTDGLGLRALLALLAGVGALVLASRSVLYASAPAIPYGWIPDWRPVVVVGLVAGLGLAGAFFQGARTAMLWTVVLLVVIFELDHATIHWFSSFPGTLAGGRIDPVRLAGSVVAIGATLLLHADVAAHDARRDFGRRGVTAAEAAEAAEALASLARRRVVSIGAFAFVAGAVVLFADIAFGDTTLGSGEVGLAAGLAVLAVAALALLRGKKG